MRQWAQMGNELTSLVMRVAGQHRLVRAVRGACLTSSTKTSISSRGIFSLFIPLQCSQKLPGNSQNYSTNSPKPAGSWFQFFWGDCAETCIAMSCSAILLWADDVLCVADGEKYHFRYLTWIYLCMQVKTTSAMVSLFLAKARITYCS